MSTLGRWIRGEPVCQFSVATAAFA